MANYFAFGFAAAAVLAVSGADYVTQARVAGSPVGAFAPQDYMGTVRARVEAWQSPPDAPDTADVPALAAAPAAGLAGPGDDADAAAVRRADRGAVAPAAVRDTAVPDPVEAAARITEGRAGDCRSTTVGKFCSASQ